MLNNKSVLESPVFIWGNIGFDFIRKNVINCNKWVWGAKWITLLVYLNWGPLLTARSFVLTMK